MRGYEGIARTMRRVEGVGVRRDFEVETLGGVWTPERVPIIINNFNRLTYLRRVVDTLQNRGYENLYVIDNDSTYGPLLDYYRAEGLRVFYLDKNVGYLALWTTPVAACFVDDYYIYTDSDIEPAPVCPDDFVTHFREGLDRNPAVDKVGFGLKTDDIPDHYALKQRVVEHERQFQANSRGREFYSASIDTTMALYRPGAAGGSWLRSLRTSEPYVARHLPWYEDSAHPSAEEQFYLDTIRTSTHWSNRAGDSKNGVLEVPLDGEMVRVVADRSDDLWNVVSRGEWKTETLDLIDRLVDGSHSYLEVGSGPGPTVLYAARVARRVYALEPDPANREELEKNIGLNGEAALRVEIVALRGSNTDHSGAGPSFTEFVEAHDLADCDLVSVDLDGQEWRVIPDMLPYLRRARPTVCVNLRPGLRCGVTTATAAGKAAIAALGVLSAWRLMWTMRFYRHLYDAQGARLTPWRVFRLLSSRIPIVASDRSWPSAPKSAQAPR